MIADAFTYPVRSRYKQRDSAFKDTVKNGDYHRTNWILAGYKLLGKYDSIHEGDDVVGYGFNCYGHDVLAIANGVVIHAELVPKGTWGNIVIVEHELPSGTKIYSRYAHLKDRLVRVGDEVTIGQIIGHIGGPEWGMAPHLHICICVTDLLVRDPRNWPSTGRTPAEARAIITTNYIDPLFYIDSHQKEVPPAPEQEPDVTSNQMYVATKDARLMLRQQPNSGAVVIAKLQPGTQVTAYDLVEGNYQLVKFNTSNLFGFVAKEYLSPTAPV